ncbi:MAG: chemotaxis protein CheB [Prochlorotrichaceae cyanobacterium]
MATSNLPEFVVGIGASAGGLKALEQFFDELSHTSGAAFVVIQHNSESHENLMPELLARHTQMSIYLAEDALPLIANSVYFVPPGKVLAIRNRTLYLSVPHQIDDRYQFHFPIDFFFHSLANDCENRAIGVILSGSGSDGSNGIRAIHEKGGIAMVQSPTTAEFDQMPQSALQTGAIDQVLAPGALATLINELVRTVFNNSNIKLISPTSLSESLDSFDLLKVIKIVADQSKIDFSQYKPTTLIRRIQRRCLITGLTNFDVYCRHLEASEEERILLRNDLLISVTQFFRDLYAWEFLEVNVIPTLFTQLEPEQGLRLWVTACATGEEAYSLAILVSEVRQRLNLDVEVKIFATDIDRRSLERASKGIYAENIAHSVSEERLQKYFIRHPNGYEVTRHIREMLIFSEHNLTVDPMFLRMHLVSCRNVLIYMQPYLQRQVLQNLHFSLGSKGILFLGESETLGSLEKEFNPLNRTWKIYQKVRDVRLSIPPSEIIPPRSTAIISNKFKSEPAFDPLLDTAFKQYLALYQATCILVDRDNNLLHVVADEANILEVPQGRVTYDIMRMVPQVLQLPLSIALHRAKQTLKSAQYTDINLKEGNRIRNVQLQVTYRPGGSLTQDFLIIEIKAEDTNEEHLGGTSFPAADVTDHILELENELQQTRQNLQITIEELEKTNEEQTAANEEFIASNEELQSTNEELQSTNEELHAVNEELHRVNAECQSKIYELIELNTDLDHLLQNIKIGVIFLDETLCIRKFTHVATQIINLMATDVGRPIAHLSHNMNCTDFLDLIQRVMNEPQTIDREVQIEKTNFYLLMRIHPYYLENGSTQGVVITFVDINDIKVAEARVKASEIRVREANAALEQRVAERTKALTYFSQGLHQLHQINIQRYITLEPILTAYLAKGCTIFQLEHGIIAQRQEDDTLILQCVHSDSKSLEVGIIFDYNPALSGGSSHSIPLLSQIKIYRETTIVVSDKIYGIVAFFSTQQTDDLAELTTYQGEIIQVIANNIGSAIESNQQLEQNWSQRLLDWRKSHDPLTNLLNREYFEDKLKQALAGVKNEGQTHVLCHLDLDQFKNINDTYGYLAGNELLKQIVDLLQDKMRTIDTLARLEEDEFGLLLHQCPLKQGVIIAEAIRQSIHDFEFVWNENLLEIRSSIGVVEINSNMQDFTIVLNTVSAACQRAKEEGRNRVCVGTELERSFYQRPLVEQRAG